MNMKLIAVAAVLALSGCAPMSDDTAIRALEGAGYTDIHVTGFKVFGCDKNDIFHAGFEATGPSGKRVTGVVCGGVFKGSTVRTD